MKQLSVDEFRIRLSELNDRQKRQEQELHAYRLNFASLEAQEAANTARRNKLMPFKDIGMVNADMLKTLVYSIVIASSSSVTLKFIE